VKPDPGLWKIAPPEIPAPAETAGLNKEEADFVSKYLSLADELLKKDPMQKPDAISEDKLPADVPPSEQAA
jgi:hypothetical protein